MPVPGISGVSGVSSAFPATAAARVGAPSATAFGDVLTSAVENLQNVQQASSQLAVAAVTGDLNDIHQATIASTRAAVTLELVSTVRNRGVEAFNEIMRMQA
ncbi:flagellar hook-basal body complex protein FliE [Naasia sp. SYSU D00948]|uniref:flagellar hook-basal body complex protein FliE n=1 Tax=Naasia sp. SYSU D00948 TaxID=2817379 RepID=UPI001B3151C5|nr:flagellar hook-basal body complex protein FliE [Naasia sp. SYSU D00948]